jgi:MFS transporter, ACS family, tartrate transporter
MGWLRDLTGGFGAGLWAIAACAVVGMLVVLSLHHDRSLEQAPSPTPAE